MTDVHRRRFLLGGITALGVLGTEVALATTTAGVVGRAYAGSPSGHARCATRRDALLRAARPTPRTIDDVVGQLAHIRDVAAATSPRGTGDGASCFSALYHEITVGVRDSLGSQDRTQADFVERLDVAFARLYIDALRRYGRDPATCPASWRVLLDRRDDPGIPEVQFAAAGVNAHINFDLAFALVDAWSTYGAVDVHRFHDAYLTINDVFYRNMGSLRRRFGSTLSSPGSGTRADRVGTLIGDVLVRWTRDRAWATGVALWEGRTTPGTVARERAQIDRDTALAGLAILRTPWLPS